VRVAVCCHVLRRVEVCLSVQEYVYCMFPREALRAERERGGL